MSAYTRVAPYLEVLSDLTDETLEWQFTNEKFRGLLIPTNLAERDGTRTEPMGLLHTTSGGLEGQRGSARDPANNGDEDKRKHAQRQSCEQL